MSQNDNQGALLNRNKSNEDNKFHKKMEEIEKQTVNEALATQFPAWDLKPPSTLVKRRSSKLL
ncbi:hypothetical protein MM300_06985 [Evansella sp. LMS18]|jgi:hypothetical protein|uniref:hypothetical protein n=1 Tax=Evansella sp. LMS18 TaxID=2924033 RepID=UPI0020D053D4|nr:hypothetical protein [Evansella sp. LMS18]UTR12029.1 hypothetical protein MM300_06985 [Evansella sp. LMS18]